jgi:hypothetical protein
MGSVLVLNGSRGARRNRAALSRVAFVGAEIARLGAGVVAWIARSVARFCRAALSRVAFVGAEGARLGPGRGQRVRRRASWPACWMARGAGRLARRRGGRVALVVACGGGFSVIGSSLSFPRWAGAFFLYFCFLVLVFGRVRGYGFANLLARKTVGRGSDC